MFYRPKTQKPPGGGFRFAELRSSTLRVLLAPPRLVKADLLSLHLARVARHQAGRAEHRLQRGIVLDERARNAMPHRAGLAALAAAIHVDEDVEAREALRQFEGLANHHPAGLAPEEFIDRLAVD